jgi:hypothetical protein
MKPPLSPEEAFRRAYWMVKFPSMAVLLGPLLTFVLLARLKYGGWLVWVNPGESKTSPC